ncbi:MAG: capsular biosynthesis protein CpsI [Cycloclasticus sp.]|nr:MAG: capsular biosynthesis protein CpsI [Cycloclasticus sp.]
MKVLVTGSAGFIGSALCLKLLERGNTIYGIDNHNDYYSTSLKEDRLNRHINHPNYTHFRVDIADRDALVGIFNTYKPEYVVNLAAQAGVRYSIDNPSSYIDSNLVGFGNILECSRQFDVKHLVYASSSSVYGANKNIPYSIHHNVDHPVSLYAATKKANELMAHTYSHLFAIPTTGLRFFTVYGPWDRPDMALQKFTKAILADKAIKVFNYGNHKRDFTYIDDIIDGVIHVLDRPATSNPVWDGKKADPGTSIDPWRLYNIGSNKPYKLLDYINALEKNLGKKAKKELLPMQPGDVEHTYADITDLIKDFDYKPSTKLEDGIRYFVQWYVKYHNITL